MNSTGQSRGRAAFPSWTFSVALTVLTLLSACGGGSSGGGNDFTVSARAQSASSIALSWNRPSEYPADGSFAIVLTSGAEVARVSTTSFTVSNLSPETQYCFFIRRFTLIGAIPSNTACATTPADSSPPSVPSGLTANAVGIAEVNLAWNPSSDDARVDGYNVFRDGVPIGSVSGTGWNAAPAIPGATNCFTVSAFDTAGKESGHSASACVTLAPDVDDPTVPTGVFANYSDAGGATTIVIEWQPSADDGRIDVYLIERDGVPLGESPTTSFTDDSIAADTSYCYAISARDASGKESAPSDRDCARVGWKKTTLQAGVHGVDLDLDSNDDPHIAYKDRYLDSTSGTFPYALEYVDGALLPFPPVTRLASGPETFYFADAGLVAIAIDGAGDVHIAHKIDKTPFPETIEYWRLSGSSRQSAAIEETSEQMKGIALDTDSSNVVHACYGLGSALYYANNAGGSWAPVDAATLAAGAVGANCDIAVAPDDSIHVSFTETGTSNLMYLSNRTGAWVLDTLEPNTGGQFYSYGTSIAVDQAGAVHIAFFNDRVDFDLEYATNASGGWVTTKPDSIGDVGYMPRLAVDANGAAHIVYQDLTSNSLLKYATNSSGAWVTGYLGDVSGVEQAIAVDAMGFGHVAYTVGQRRLIYLSNRP